jgi:flavin reductase (DIM6/NTAB) family NADH-FMN oxidoreductase RutF
MSRQENGASANGSVEVDRFREMMSRFPTGVAVVTAMDGDGAPHGATCSSLSSVTLTPPTLLVCLQVDGATVSAIQSTRRFAVNLLRFDSRRVAKVFASPGADRFGEVRWRSLSTSGLPYLHHDAFAVADCEVTHELVIGDHVVMAGVPSDIWLSPGEPLLYGSRRFFSWVPDHSLPEGLTR